MQIYLYISKKNLTFAPDLGASALHASTCARVDIDEKMTRTTTIQRIQTMGKQILPKGSHLWLYGSRARGTHRPNSDWDLLVLVDKDKQQLQDFDSYAYPFIEMGWELGEEINPMLYTRKEWEQRYFTPFYHNVEDDKIELV